MHNYARIEQQLIACLSLEHRPVGVIFSDQELAVDAPRTVPQASGCIYWKMAADGQTCHTQAEHHYNCAIGSHTHKIQLPDSRAGELAQTLGLMSELGYLSMDEVPLIPQLKATPTSIVYSPLADCRAAPQVVLIAVDSRSAMLVQEAARRAGVGINGSLLGRPTCMALPAAMQTGLVTSLGCVGNRFYTQLSDGELYVVIPGEALASLVSALPAILNANRALGQWHLQRQTELAG